MKINDIYETISGEFGKFPQGAYCTIIRFQGCNLRCIYCDTKQSWNENTYTEMTVDEIVDKVKTKNVLITGGEPLYQRDDLMLLLGYLSPDHIIQVETNGACSIPSVHIPNVSWIVDYKGYSSGVNDDMGNNIDFVSRVYPAKYIKFVVADKSEIIKAINVINAFKDNIDSYDFNIMKFAFSPLDGNPKLVKMIIETCKENCEQLLLDGYISISVQLHKLVDMA